MKYFQIALLLFWWNPLATFGCTCDTISFMEAVEWADEIFIGTLVKAEKFENGYGWDRSGNPDYNYNWSYTFEVDKKWKGSSRTRVTLYDEGHSCDLGFQLWPDQYLIYASYNPEFKSASVSGGSSDGKSRLHTWLCSRTIYARESSDSWYESDVKKLDKMFPDFTRRKRKQFRIVVIIPLGIWLILSAIGLYIVRKTTRNGHKPKN